jgi:hypothetical protein
MAQATNLPKSKVEIIIDISHFNLTTQMATMFPIHSLHLPKVIIDTNNRGEFKQNIIITCSWNAMNILNAKFIIVQIFQLRTNMHGK